MSDSGALRKVFADFGVHFDDKELAAGSNAVDAATKKLATLASAGLGDRVVGQFTKISGGLRNLVGNLNLSREETARVGQIATGVAAAYVAVVTRATHAAFAFADAFRETADRIRYTAAALRVSTDQLQEFEFAGAEAGVGAEQMAGAMTHLRDAARSVALGGGLTGNAFARLGVQVRTAAGRMRETGQIADDVANAFARITSPVRRAQVAQELFGAAGQRLQAVLHGGAGGLAALRDEFYALGGGVSQDAIEAARQYGAQVNRLAQVGQAWRAQMALALLPVLTRVVGWVRQGYAAFVQWTRGTEVIRIGMYALIGVAAVLGAALLYAFAPVLIPLAAVAAGIAAIVLVVDDLITLFRGGDSVAGRFIDSMFGAGTAAAVVRTLRDAWHEVYGALQTAWGFVQRVSSHPAFRFLSAAVGASRRLVTGAVGEVINDARVIGNVVAGNQAAARAAFAQTLGGQAYAALHATPAVAVARPAAATPATPAPGTGAAAARGRRAPQRNTIHIHGITDPRAVARAVDQRLDERAAASADADHPMAPIDDRE